MRSGGCPIWPMPAASASPPGKTIDGTSDTDGIEISTASFGPGAQGGLMVAQDGDNAPEAQNFKIVRWGDVRRALRLR
ncbi:MAG: phytase [Sphingomonas sp.]